jgi:hypothetical protein
MVQQGLALGLINEADVAAINEGELRSYHDGGGVPESEHRLLRAYEVLFRAMPMLPKRIRADVRILRALERLPNRMSHFTALFVDGLNGLRVGSNDHTAYGAHYLYWMARVMAERAGAGFPAATTPANIDEAPAAPTTHVARSLRLPLVAGQQAVPTAR